MSGIENWVQLPVDSTDNKNKIRVLELVPDASVADGDGTTTVVQEVVALGDSDGFFLHTGGYGASKLDVALQREILEELRTLTRGMAYLLGVMQNGMRPKGSFPAMHAWIGRVLK